MRVAIPKRVSLVQAIEFTKKKETWINKTIIKLTHRFKEQKQLPAIDIISGSQFLINRINELADKYSVKVIDMYLKEMLNYSERRMRQALKQIPQGNYSFSDFIEGDGIDDKLFKIEVDLSVKGESIIADFSSSD